MKILCNICRTSARRVTIARRIVRRRR